MYQRTSMYNIGNMPCINEVLYLFHIAKEKINMNAKTKSSNQIDWGRWQTLLAVSRMGTYSKAATSLYVDATTVARRIALLEKRIGRNLFFRQNGRLCPTDYCEQLLSHVETAYESLRSAEHESIQPDNGVMWRSLRLTAAPFLVTNILAPKIYTLTQKHQIRIELIGTPTNVSLSKREADIAIRIEDSPEKINIHSAQVKPELIGNIDYAVYCKKTLNAEHLPWAGIMENLVRSSGSQTMLALAGADGFRYSTLHFDSLVKIIVTGAAKAMLPCFLANKYRELKQLDHIVLSQPLWMLSHQQDTDIPHLKSTRSWIRDLVATHF